MSTKTAARKTRTATHRPAARKRRFRHDDLVAVDLFSGFGGLSQGIERAGFTTIMAANHNPYKIEVHEANHPHAEHWIADLVDKDSADYHSARDLPAADLLVAGVSCVNHSQANTERAYAQSASLFDMDDPDFEARVTRSERDRATANCVLHYAAQHHPLLILVECTTELQSWGPAIPGKTKVGDGSTYRWWLQQFVNLGYRYKVLYLNSQFFGVGQSRDRYYAAFWDAKLPAPDLDHRPHSWCAKCSTVVEAVQSWKTGIPATGTVRYGKQYNYRCPSCATEVIPPLTPSLAALDLTNLGTKIGERTKPLAPATMARAERCRRKFADFPAVLMPAKAIHGTERHPMSTQTSQQETAILSTGAVLAAHRHNGDGQHITAPMDTVTTTHEKAVLLSTAALIGAAGHTYERPGSECRTRGVDEPLWTQSATNTIGMLTPPVALAVDNFQGVPRGSDQPLPTQGGSETLAIVSSGVLPYRQNTLPATHAEVMPTFTYDQVPGILTAAGRAQCNGSIDEAADRSYPLDKPLGTAVGSAITQGLLFGGWYKQNGSQGDETAPHPLADPFGTLTSRDTTAILTAEWQAMLADLPLDECYFRMMAAHEIGRGCGFDVDFADHQGTFIVWGSAREQVDGFGNAVTPAVGEWISSRLRASLHREYAA